MSEVEKDYSTFLRSMNLRDKIEKMPVQDNGHRTDRPSFMNLFSLDKDIHFMNALFSLEEGNIENNSLLVGTCDCSTCGKEVSLLYNGKELFSETVCESEVKPFSFDIPIPSGILVVDNCLRKHFKNFDRYVNHFCGIKASVEDYAQQNMFHTYVGNTCPAIIQKSRKRIEFGQFDNKQKVGSISTDLWWFSAIDIDILRNMYVENNDIESFNNIINNDVTLINVTPGTYRCTSYYAVFHDKKNLYADMVWVSKDIKLNSLNVEINKEESYLQEYVDNKFPMLYPTFSNYIYHKMTASSYGHNSWFKYNFDSKKEEAMNAYNFKDFLSSDFFDKIPTFKYFLPKNKRFSFGKERFLDSDRELDINQMWTGYEYAVSVEYLAYLLVLVKTLYIKKEKLLSRENSVDILTKIMNMAYTNIIERNLEDEIASFLNKIDFKSEVMISLHHQLIKEKEHFANQAYWYFKNNNLELEFNDWKQSVINGEYEEYVVK